MDPIKVTSALPLVAEPAVARLAAPRPLPVADAAAPETVLPAQALSNQVSLLAQGQVSASIAFVDQHGSALGDRVETMQMAGDAGADMQTLQGYAQTLVEQPPELEAVISALQAALSAVEPPVMMVEVCKIPEEQREKLKSFFEKAGFTALVTQLESGSTHLSFESVSALYYSLKPIHTLMFSQDASERNSALFQLKVSNDLLQVLPSLKANNHLTGAMQVMDLSNSLTELSANNSSHSGLSRLSKEIVDTQARGTFNAEALSETTSRITLSPLDTVLGNLLLDPNDSDKAQRLNQLLQRSEQGTLSPEDKAQLMAFGLEEKEGQLFIRDGKSPSNSPLSKEDLTQITSISSALATPVAKRSKDVQAFLDTFQKVIKNTKLLETLTQKRNDLQAKADQLMEQLNQDERDLAEIETTLGDLDGLLKRFDKDGLTAQDMRILAKLGIEIRAGHFVKNKFFDANGQPIKRKDIEQFLKAKQAELTQEIARKRQDIGNLSEEIGKTDEEIAQTATDLVQGQADLDNAYQRLSPEERTVFAPAYESARRQTRRALAEAIQALLKSKIDPNVLQNLMDGFARLNNQASQDGSQTEAPTDSPETPTGPLAPVSPSVTGTPRSPRTETEAAFHELESTHAQATAVQHKLESQLLDQAGQSRRRNRERAENRQAWLRIAQDQILNQEQLKSMLKDSAPVGD